MKLAYILASLFFLIKFNTEINDINPIGTYELKRNVKIKNGETYGYFGEIRINRLNSDKIIMAFEVCKGAPSYNSGSFIDTLNYVNNQAIYTNAEIDTSCKITFDFSKDGITVTETAEDFNSGCGFGHAVIADGFYKKYQVKLQK